MLAFLILGFLMLMAIGLPIAFAIGIAGALAVYLLDLPLMLVPHRMVTQLDSYSLLALPYFVLAGLLMEKGGISHRLFRFANVLTGHWRGGLAQSAMGASIVMSGLSGSGVADISAVGSIATPGMRAKSYAPGFTAAILASGGFLGPIIPPSIMMIVYGSITGLSIGALFLAGVIPGLVLGLSFMVLIWYRSGRKGYVGEPRATGREVWEAFAQSWAALIAPVILVGGIVTGIFTATEAGAVAAVYAFIVGFFIYRELKLKDLFPALLMTGRMTGAIFIIIATAALLGWLLQRMQMPQAMVSMLSSITEDPTLSLLIIIALLLVIACFVEVLAAAIILIPVLSPVGAHLGFDPLHFAFVVVLALQIGTITPPVGVYLFLANSIAGARLEETVREVLPFLAVMIAGLLVFALVPQITLFFPQMFFD